MNTKVPEYVIILRWFTLLLVLTIFSAMFNVHVEITKKNIPMVVHAQIPVLPSPTPREENPIKAYINEVFGKDAPKAYELLQSPSCHENLSLNPLAVNDNTKWGGIGRDRGIFQINDVFHPGVSDACAFDYKCNIEYAHRMFINDNHTFVRWTCGRTLGI